MSIGIVKFIKADSGIMFNNRFTQTMMDSYFADVGLSGRTVNLSAEVMAVSYNTLGLSPSPNSIQITATAENTVGTPYFEFLVDNVSVQNGTSTTYSYIPKSSYSDMPDKIEVRLRENETSGTVYDIDIISIFGVKAGTNAITVALSNEAHTIPFTIAGVGTYTGSGTNIRVWEGATELLIDTSSPYSNSTFRVEATATNITKGSETQLNGQPVYTIGDHSSMINDVASISFQITVTTSDGVEISFTRIQSISKSKQGDTGPAGESTAGVGIVYRGIWDSSKTYYRSGQRIDVVLHEDNFYICEETNSDQEPSEAPTYWSSFEEEFESVATGLLLAEDATIVKSLVMGIDDGVTTGLGTIRSATATGFFTGNGYYITVDSSGNGKIRVGKIEGGVMTEGFYWDGTGFKVVGEIEATTGKILGEMTVGTSLILNGNEDGTITGGVIRTSDGDTRVELKDIDNKLHFHFVDSASYSQEVVLDGFAMNDEPHLAATDRFLVLASGASRTWGPGDILEGYSFLQLQNTAYNGNPFIRLFKWSNSSETQVDSVLSSTSLSFFKDGISNNKFFSCEEVDNNFCLLWGNIGDNLLDTNLYRSGSNALATDDLFKLANKIVNPTTNSYGLTFGGTSAGTSDTNLYRSAQNTLKTDDNLDVNLKIYQDDIVRPYITISNDSTTTVTVDIKCRKFNDVDSANNRMMVHWWISSTEFGPPNKDLYTESDGQASVSYLAGTNLSPEAIDDKVLNTTITDSNEIISLEFDGNGLADESLTFYLMAEVQGIVYASSQVTLLYASI